MDDSSRFRGAYDYAKRQGFVAGYPNMEEATYAQLVYGTVLLPDATASWRDMTSAEVQGASLGNFPDLARRINAWATPERGFSGGFPNGYVGTDALGNVVHGAVLFRPGNVRWMDVPADDLGNPDVNNVGEIMRAASRWASRRGLVGAVPTFNEAQVDGRRVCGLLLLAAGSGEWRDVPAWEYAPEANLLLTLDDQGTKIVLHGERFSASSPVEVLYQRQLDLAGPIGGTSSDKIVQTDRDGSFSFAFELSPDAYNVEVSATDTKTGLHVERFARR